MGHRFFDSGMTQNELMKRAFRIKPIASNLPHDLALPPDLREQFTEMRFMRPTDLELGTYDERDVLEDKADMLKPVRTVTVALNAHGSTFMPIMSELLAAVPPDLLYSVSAFSALPDKKQPNGPDGRQRAIVTFYEGELPQKFQDQYIIYDGQAYSPSGRLMDKLERIEVMKPVKIKGPGR
jgi:hypothetical protein